MSEMDEVDTDSSVDLDETGKAITVGTAGSIHSLGLNEDAKDFTSLSPILSDDEDSLISSDPGMSSKVISAKAKQSRTATADECRQLARKKLRAGTSTKDPETQSKHRLVVASSKARRNKKHFEAEVYLFPPDYSDVEFSDDERLERLERRPQFKDIIPQRAVIDIELADSKGIIPGPISQWLRDYQIHGVAFLHKLFAQQRGGILGDDMGLGKTVQIIAFLTAAFGKTGDSRDGKRRRKIRGFTQQWFPRVLLVCPGSLIANWKDELSRWGWWDVGIYHGNAKDKEEAIHAAQQGQIEIMITTYNTYLTHQEFVNQVDWDCVIADECHCLKGKKSQVTAAMNVINAKCRIGLTGTAIQNNYDELWSLLHWTNPSELGNSRDWSSMISEPLKQGQSHDATLAQLGRARAIAERLVHNLLPRFFLRRTKALIADQLPRKFDRVVFCPLTSTQVRAYTSFTDSVAVQCIKTSSEPCDCGSEAKRGWCCYRYPQGFEESWKQLVFPAMLSLSKLSNHVSLLLPNRRQDKEKQLRDIELLKLALPKDWKFYCRRLDMDNYTDLELFGKWRVLKKLLSFWEPRGDKVLVFSHSTRLLDVLRVLFTSTSYTVCYLDGKMSLPARAAEVAKFNSNPDQFIFCISTKAGGVGLNITSANKVIILDPNWNPAYDLQAQDRAFRIGQQRNVEVFRLISIGTIEEAIYARQIYKQQQAAIAYTASNERRHFRGVHGTAEQGDIFGLENLFTFSKSMKLKDILDKTEIAETRTGVAVASINVSATDPSHEDDENAAMSHYAKALSQGQSDVKIDSTKLDSQADPIQAILSQAGIAYSHDNKDTLGSSRIEAELGTRARQHKADPIEAMQRVFHETENNEETVYKWRPSEAVRKSQFRKMARGYGEDVNAFAVRVENWNAEQRRTFLNDYYDRRSCLRKQHKKDNRSKTQTARECDMDRRTAVD